MAKEWKDKIGVIEYGTNTYVTNSGTVFLVVNAKKLKRLKDKYRIVSGRKI
jgi:hypothetical protein